MYICSNYSVILVIEAVVRYFSAHFVYHADFETVSDSSELAKTKIF